MFPKMYDEDGHLNYVRYNVNAVVGLMGCRTNGLSNQWVVEPLGCRTTGIPSRVDGLTTILFRCCLVQRQYY